jgi:hypothetical protein
LWYRYSGQDKIKPKNPQSVKIEDFQKKGNEPSIANTLFQKKRACLFRQAHKERQRHTLPQIAVPSAQAGLTSLFEMGRGEPRRNNHLKNLCRKVFKSHVLKSSRDIMTFDILTLRHFKLGLKIS